MSLALNRPFEYNFNAFLFLEIFMDLCLEIYMDLCFIRAHAHLIICLYIFSVDATWAKLPNNRG